MSKSQQSVVWFAIYVTGAVVLTHMARTQGRALGLPPLAVSGVVAGAGTVYKAVGP